MNCYNQKVLCHTAIITLLSTFFHPLYAGPIKQDLPSQGELEDHKPPFYLRSGTLEGVLQEKKLSAHTNQPLTSEIPKNHPQPLAESLKAEQPFFQSLHRHMKRAVGDEFIINQNTTGIQTYPSVTLLNDGNVFVAWYGAQTGNFRVYGRVFLPDGTAWNNEFTINQNTSIVQERPSIARLTNGNVCLVWERNLAGNYDIYGRVFLPDGTPASNEFTVNQNTTGTQVVPSVAGLPNGNGFVVWYGNNDIYGRILLPDGTASNDEFIVNQNTTGSQTNPSVASLTNGNVFVAWYGNQTGNFELYGRIFLSDGAPDSNEFPITQKSPGLPLDISLASLANGNVFVAWPGVQTGNSELYGRIFLSDGAADGKEFAITQNSTGAQRYPSVAPLNDGNAFVVWHGFQNVSFADIYGRVFLPSGAAKGNEFIINQNTTNNQIYPSVAPLNDGNGFVVWSGSQTGNTDIYGRIVSLSSSTTSTTASSTTSTTAISTTTSAATTASSTTSTTKTSSSHRLMPTWLIPAKVVIGGMQDLWNLALITSEHKKDLQTLTDEIERSSKLQLTVWKEEREEPSILATSPSPSRFQKMGNYFKSWFSYTAWSDSFDSVLRSAVSYSKSVVNDCPSYFPPDGYAVQKAFFAPPNTVFYVNSTLETCLLPHSVVSGIIGK